MRYRRVLIPGATYFFTINLLNRKSYLLITHIDKLRKAFKRVQILYPFEIDGVVILPDHFHLLMSLPSGDYNYSLRIRLIKSIFSKQIEKNEFIIPGRKKKGERGIWQRRFWEHVIRNEIDFERHLNYIHYNPVKHKYVKNPSEWPYSSIHRLIKQGVFCEHWASNNGFSSESFGE